MAWQPTPYTLPLLVATALSAVIALLAWRCRDRPGALWLSVLMAAVTGWTLGYALGLARADMAGKLLFSKAMYAGVVAVPVGWVLFVLGFTGRRQYVSPRNVGLLSVVPAVTLALAWTNGHHGLVWRATRLSSEGSFAVMTVSYGPWFWVHAAYSYLLLLAGTLLLVQLFVRSRHIYRGQIGAVLLGAFVPWGGNALYLWKVSPLGRVDPTPLAFTLTGALLFGALFRYELLDIVPMAREIARDEVIDSMDDGVVVLDGQGRVVDLNPVAEELVDQPARNAVGRPIGEHLPALADLLADGEGGRDELVLDGDGSRRTFDVRVSPLFREVEFLGGRLVMLRDVTERTRAEQRFEALIRHSQDLVTVVDEAGTFQYLSPSASHILGYDPDELIGENAFEFIHPDDRDRVFETFTGLIQQPGYVSDRAEYRFRRSDGSWVWFESIGSNQKDTVIDGYVVNSRDVTERRRYERRLQVLNRVLRHDLRNDMNTILAHAETILTTPENAVDRARAIKEKGLEVAELSEKARQLERALETDETDRQSVDIVDRIEHRLAAARRDHPEIEIETDLPESAYVPATELIDSAINNLIENAIEHNDTETPELRVSVAVAEDGDAVDFSIADNGPGLPENEREVLRKGRETQLEHSSGLGLWLIHWIVTECGGDIRFEDNQPRGTVITVRLPTTDPPEATG